MSKSKTQAEMTERAAPAQVAERQATASEKMASPLVARKAASHEHPNAGSAQPAARAARGSGAAGRARAWSSMQREVGNAWLSRMTAEDAGSGPAKREEDGQNSASPRDERAAPHIQTLAVSRPDDPSEREAERVARSITSGQKAPPVTSITSGKILPLLQREGMKEEEQKPAVAYSVQRREKQEEKEPPRLAQRVEGAGEGAMDTSAASEGIANKGAGSPVSPALRSAIEPRMGADLGAARVHNDSAANEAASAIGARAFTHGRDIFLARGESENDTGLMAHELAHVVQQTSANAVGNAPRTPLVHRKEGVPPQPVAAKATKGRVAQPAAAELIAPGVLELKGMKEFAPPAPVEQFLEENKGDEVVVKTRFGKLAAGDLKVKKEKDGDYKVKTQPIPLSHPLFARVGEAMPGLEPSLVVEVKKNQLEGYVGLAAAAKLPKDKLENYIEKSPDLIGLAGFSVPNVKLTNKIEGGQLHLGLSNVPAKLGGAFTGTVSFEVIDEKVAFDGKADIAVKGLATGTLEMKRNEEGLITGRVAVALQLPKNFTGAVDVAWDGRAITGEGKVGYTGEKLSGEVTLRLMEKGQAAQLEKEKKAPPEEAGREPAAAAAPAKAEAKKPKHVDYVVFGEGDLTFAFNDWLNGTAHVIVDPKGFVTIIGKITPQKEFPLFEPKEFVEKIFKVEARAAYGIPVVGNIFIFANFGMDAFAKLEGKLYNITAEGTYSTDPEKAVDFKISGSLNISAAAGLRLRGEVGAGIEILSHDLKVGAGINGIVGVKAYAEATPVIGYREKGAPGEDKKGEFYIRGDVEVAAQPFLGLSGDLFLEVDAPWWSPIDDDRWTWPLFNKEYPLGGSFGLKMSVDYIFGSGQWPAVEFKPAEFDGDKFTTDLYNDRAQPKSGEKGDQKGDWKEKNEQQPEPPAEAKGKGNALPGKPQELPPAKPKVAPGGPKGGAKKPADPNAKTAEGKSVKQLQEEAEKKGKKPAGKDPKTGAPTAGDAPKDPAKKEHDEELKKGLAALEAVTERYAKDGASKEEVVGGVKSVRRKFKVFKSIEVIDGGETWDYEYVADPGTKKGPPKSKAGKSGILKDGTVELRKGEVNEIKDDALAQLKNIKKAGDVSNALVELEKGEKDVLKRYKGEIGNDGYIQYLDGKKTGDTIEWPRTYLKKRAARKKGKLGESHWLKKAFPNATKRTFMVEQEKGGFEVRIPDGMDNNFVVDVKDVAEQSFDAQLRDFYIIARQKDPLTKEDREVTEDGKPVSKKRGLAIIVRKKTATQEKTKVTGPLESEADMHYIITDELPEEEK